ncbi:MAG: oligosaccharide repeat unit polymerase [Candidatus Zixiibacteriota bacterium]
MKPSENHLVRQIIVYILIGFLITSTFSIALSQILAGLAMFLGLYLIICEKNYHSIFKLNNFAVLILLYITWTVMSSIASPTPVRSFISIREHWLFLIIPVFAIFMKDDDIIERAMTLLAISAIVVSLYGIWQHFSGLDLWRGKELIPAPDSGYYPIGKFRSRSTFSLFFLLISTFYLGLAPYAENKSKTILYYLTSLVSTIAIFLTVERGPIIVMAICLVIFVILAWNKINKIAFSILIIILIGSVYFASPGIVNRFKNWTAEEIEGKHPRTRISTWRTAAQISFDNPIVGVGAGNFRENYIQYQTLNKHHYFDQAHNDILTNAVNFGFPGAILFFGFWLAFFAEIWALFRKKRVKEIRRAIIFAIMMASIAFFISSQWGAAFVDEEPRALLMALWGLFFAVKQQVKKNEQSSEMIEKA